MTRTIRRYKDYTYLDKDPVPKQKTSDRKSFVYRGDGWYTKSKGGPGNKQGWMIHSKRTRFRTLNDPCWEEKIPSKQRLKKRIRN